MSGRARAQPWFGRGPELLTSLQVRVDLLEAEGRIWQRGQLLETDWTLTSRGAGFFFRTFEDFVEWCGFSFTEPWQRRMLGHRSASPVFVTQRAFVELRTSLLLFGSSAVRVAESGGQIIVDTAEVPTAQELLGLWSAPRGLVPADETVRARGEEHGRWMRSTARSTMDRTDALAYAYQAGLRPGKSVSSAASLREHMGEWPEGDPGPMAQHTKLTDPKRFPKPSRVPEQLQHKPWRKRR